MVELPWYFKAHRTLVLLGNQNPGRVFLVKMPGRMGHQNNTGFNLEVLHTDGEAGILIVKGNVPGPKNQSLKVSDAIKRIW